MNTKSIAIVGLGIVLFAGCATFDHQTVETEPHALITIIQPWENQAGTLKRFDGMSVSAGKTYRVRPGNHTVVMAFKERSVETYKPASYSLFGSSTQSESSANLQIAENGQTTVSGLNPSQGMQSVNLSLEHSRIRLVTNSITVEAGGRYQLQGNKLTEKLSSVRNLK